MSSGAMTNNELTFDHANNFDFLRFLAATMVVFSHSFALTGHKFSEPLTSLTGNMNFGGLGVFIFFIISGYLITKSWITRPVTTRYFWNRLLRIVPGLALVVLFCIFVIGPINTSDSIVDYFLDSATWLYLSIIAIFPLLAVDYHLPGVFLSNTYPISVNSPLWTIPYEFIMYIGVFLLGIIGLLKNRKLILLFSLSILGVWIGLRYYFNFSSSDLPVNLSYFAFYFSIGTLYFLFRDKIKFDYRIAAVALVIFLLSLSQGTIINTIALCICLPYVVFTFAFAPLKSIMNFGKHGDFSYGIYIYAFPIQQTIAHLLGNIDSLLFFTLSFFCVMPFAALSWRLVESKALSLKRIDPLELLKEKSAIFLGKLSRT